MPCVVVLADGALRPSKVECVRQEIIKQLLEIAELELLEEQIDVRFPIEYGMRSQHALVKISGLFVHSGCSADIKNRVAKKVGKALRTHISGEVTVQCIVEQLDLTQGYWISSLVHNE